MVKGQTVAARFEPLVFFSSEATLIP